MAGGSCSPSWDEMPPEPHREAWKCSLLKRFDTVAVPEAKHFDDAF